MGSILVNTFPDEFKYERDEKIAFNEEIKEKINEIFHEEKELSIEEKNMESDIMFNRLIKDLENSYTEEEALSHISEFEKSFSSNTLNVNDKKLLKSKENTGLNSLNKDIAMEKNSLILDKVKDAVKNQRKEETASGNSDDSLAKGFSELLDSDSKDSDDTSSEDKILSSDAKGNVENGKKDGQGGSGISYGESKSEFEESLQYRDSSEEIYDSGEEVMQISNENYKETHIVKASGIEEIKNGEKIYSSSSGEVIKSGDKVIINVQGIPKERMNIVREYYEGE